MASKALQIAAVARQIFGTLPNRKVRTGMQFLKKPLTGEYEARYYFDSIEPYARKVSGCVVGTVVSGVDSARLQPILNVANSYWQNIDHCSPLTLTHRNTNNHNIIGTTTLLIIPHLLLGITRKTSDEASDIAPKGERTTQEGNGETIEIKKIHILFIFASWNSEHEKTIGFVSFMERRDSKRSCMCWIETGV